MKIGLVSYHNFVKPGGVKRHVLGLYREFKKRGIEVKIIAPRRFQKEEYRSQDFGKDIILLGTSFPLNLGGGVGDLGVVFDYFSIERLLQKEKFDILHFHNFGFPSSFQIVERSKSLNVLTFHSDISGSEFLQKFPGPIYFLKQVLRWKMAGIIGVSSLALTIFKNFSCSRKIIPNGIDTKEFSPTGPKVEKFQDGRINILFLGRIEERKGLIYLLKAYKILENKYPNLRLIIVGDGELRKESEDWVKNNRLKEVVFEGEASFEEVPSYYRTADIYVSPSPKGESFGIVLTEAMASGVPVVAFANQGYKEVMRGDAAKFLVPSRNSSALAKKIEIFVKDASLREKMGQWGIREAKKYSWAGVAGEVLDFYKVCAQYKKTKKENGNSIDKALKSLYDRVSKWV